MPVIIGAYMEWVETAAARGDVYTCGRCGELVSYGEWHTCPALTAYALKCCTCCRHELDEIGGERYG